MVANTTPFARDAMRNEKRRSEIPPIDHDVPTRYSGALECGNKQDLANQVDEGGMQG